MLVFPYLFQLPTITGQPWLTATRGRTRIREAVGTRLGGVSGTNLW